MTIRKVAKLVGISYSTTRKHLLRQGQLRVRYRAIRYQRTPFSGDNRELAYLEGFRGGDLNAARTSPNSVMARVSTTHPAMLELFQQTFDAHGHCNVVPRRVFLTGYDWQVRVYLDNTFGFLIKKPNSIPESRENFFAFLAGLADSDGSWIASRDKGKSKYALVIKSEELDLLRTVRIKLESLGFHPALHLDKEKGTSKILNGIAGKRRITLTMDLWRLELYRWREVISLADEILPISRHWEKIEKMKIMLKAKKTEWTVVEPLISNLRKKIRNQVNDSIKRAGIEYKARHEGCYQSGVVC